MKHPVGIGITRSSGISQWEQGREEANVEQGHCWFSGSASPPCPSYLPENNVLSLLAGVSLSQTLSSLLGVPEKGAG